MAQKAGDDGSTCASKGRDAKLEHPGSNLVMMMMMVVLMMIMVLMMMIIMILDSL